MNRNHPLFRALQRELAGCHSVLDLGCGPSSPIPDIPWIKYSRGIDAYFEYAPVAASRYTSYTAGDIRHIDYGENTYDAVVLIDVLEHMEPYYGFGVIAKMKRAARKVAIIIVPNSPEPSISFSDENPFQYHRSEWTAGQLQAFGFHVQGYEGWKILRDDRGQIVPSNLPMHYIRAGLSSATEPLLREFPSLAHHLFATYRKTYGKCPFCGRGVFV